MSEKFFDFLTISADEANLSEKIPDFLTISADEANLSEIFFDFLTRMALSGILSESGGILTKLIDYELQVAVYDLARILQKC